MAVAAAAAAGESARELWPNPQVVYQGFVHTDMDGEEEPGLDEVMHVHTQFAKYSIKEIRKQHPLFARGSDEKVALLMNGESLVAEAREGPPLFESNVNKIVYLAHVKKVLYVINRRSSTMGRFSCHLFKLPSEKLAEELSSILWAVVRAAPPSSTLPRQTSADSPPKRQSYEVFSPLGGGGAGRGKAGRTTTMDLRVPDSSPRPPSHTGWLKNGMGRAEAESILQLKTPGTFLVRPSETQPGSFSLSLVLRDGVTNHFKICSDAGEFYMLGDELIKFGSLDDVISFYYTHQITKFGDHLKSPA